MQFVVIIVFMIGFLVLMLTHEDIKHVYTLEDVVKKTLTKPYGQHSLNFKEVKDVVEIWKWLDYGLLPAIVRHKDPVRCGLQHINPSQSTLMQRPPSLMQIFFISISERD